MSRPQIQIKTLFRTRAGNPLENNVLRLRLNIYANIYVISRALMSGKRGTVGITISTDRRCKLGTLSRRLFPPVVPHEYFFYVTAVRLIRKTV